MTPMSIEQDRTKRRTLALDELIVRVSNDGEGIPPWANEATRTMPVYRYRVEVEAPEGTYATNAWGSWHDREQANDQDHESIGYMVLGELLSAAYNPDEFFSMATDGDGGRERAQTILDMISTAEALLPALERNADAINDHA